MHSADSGLQSCCQCGWLAAARNGRQCSLHCKCNLPSIQDIVTGANWHENLNCLRWKHLNVKNRLLQYPQRNSNVCSESEFYVTHTSLQWTGTEFKIASPPDSFSVSRVNIGAVHACITNCSHLIQGASQNFECFASFSFR